MVLLTLDPILKPTPITKPTIIHITNQTGSKLLNLSSCYIMYDVCLGWFAVELKGSKESRGGLFTCVCICEYVYVCTRLGLDVYM